MLWRINNTPHKIIGSIHFLPNEIEIPPWIEASCKDIERIMFEADHTDPSLIGAGIDISGKHLGYPNAKNIYSRAEVFLKSIGIAEPFDGLRPWQATFYVMNMLIQKSGMSFSNGVEALLHKYSKVKGMEVGYLESPRRGFEVFESCDDPFDSLGFFEHLIDNIHTARTELFDIYNAWRTNDIFKLSEILEEKHAIFPAIFDGLVFQRNKEWASVAAKIVTNKQPTLFVVGALHCAGELSFLKYLSDYGLNTEIHNLYY